MRISVSLAGRLYVGRVVVASIGVLMSLLSFGAIAGAAPAAIQTNGFRFIDLAPFVTESEALTGKQFFSVPKGLQVFRGVPFHIKSPMGLNGMESARAGEHFPAEVMGIKIGTKAR